MKIHIENFRNIRSLDFEPEDGKVNFLFGVCGTGKSSLLKAMSSEHEATDATIGSSQEDIVVLVDGKQPQFDKTTIYNTQRQEALFAEDPTNDNYDIFIGDTSTLEKLIKQFDESIAELIAQQDELRSFHNQIEALQKQTGKPTSKGELTEKSKYGKATSMLVNATPRAKDIIGSHTQKHLEWISSGFLISDDYKNGICPFCAQEIANEYQVRLDEISDLSLNSLKPFLESSDLFASLGIELPDFSKSEEIIKVREEICTLYNIDKDIEQIFDFLDTSTTTLRNIDQNLLNPIELLPETKRKFPNIAACIDEINKNASSLKESLGKMHSEANKIIDGNVGSINNELKNFGIPYCFSVEKIIDDKKEANYKLVHNKDEEKYDRREGLSTGEKNLVTLLLFLKSSKEDIVLIDDPASSFDDYRRSQIFSLILECRDKTLIVASHDQAFIKRAVRAATTPERIGKIQQITQMNEETKFIDITKDSFGDFDDFILERLDDTTDPRLKIINMRLYIDVHREEFSDAMYASISSLMHSLYQKPNTKLQSEINSIDEGLCEEWRRETKRTFPHYENGCSLNREDATRFEQLILLREILKTKENKTNEEENDRKLLNDIVHMNDSLLVCLNPYKYDVWPSHLSSLLGTYRDLL